MITRFAPSPTGPLHLGHAYSALVAHDMAMAVGGTFVLRIEDIDQSRVRPAWEAQIYDDLRWLGLTWPAPVMRQSDRLPAYAKALDILWSRGLLYPCTCTRKDVLTAANAPQEGAPIGPDGVIYPRTCRSRPLGGPLPAQDTIRIDLERVADLNLDLSYPETGHRPGVHHTTVAQMQTDVGDFVISRKGMFTSYHLSVVIDDAAQHITHVVRGADIQDATQVHVLLQKLLGLPTPTYHHHRLIRDDHGKRLAKRDDARAIATYRAEGATPNDIRRLVGLPVP
ncbi:tRNA glutamyl-Q(34) synthetase GluQRS [Yoonia sp.]|uniref:tRNA glutamyl-Q(34) synthetase GluQRS n=1 Tax=Yoonia sp. TaxID=2212373 RepID=UPI0025E0E72C|nr:tRNA glutamyl-Q(34) synthetase GluQRS [Yoonia sp.]